MFKSPLMMRLPIFYAEEEKLPVLAFEAHSRRAKSVCDPPNLLLLRSERMLFVLIHLPSPVKQSSVKKRINTRLIIIVKES